MKPKSLLHAAAQFVCHHWFPAQAGCLLQVVLVDSIDAYLGPLFPQKALNAACQGGTLEFTLEYFLSHTTPNWKEALRATAQGGYIHVLRWMTNRQDGRGPWKADFENLLHLTGTLKLSSLAVRHGHLAVVQWLHEYQRYGSSMNQAVANGHLAMAQWLHKVNEETCSAHAADGAAKNGHLDMLKWLHSINLLPSTTIGCTKDALYFAAAEGHLDII
ncbi:hypothetical protein PHYSODRAFT_514134, partial [Phytophthora sojae]